MDYHDFVNKSLQEAAAIAKINYGKVKSIAKGIDGNQILTQTDLDIGRLLIDRVKNKYPSHNIIDEETGVFNRNSDYTWVIDPIDGTSNYANGLPMYGIMIGLLQQNIPIIGGVILPAFNELYYAEKDGGAFCNDTKITVTTETDLRKLLIVYMIDGHPENPRVTETECILLSDIILQIRNLRASNSCFDLMMVAQGKYGASLNRTCKIWDNVAPQVIIEEAGGLYTDFIGRPMDYINPTGKSLKNYTVCAAEPKIHRLIQNIVKNYNFKD